MPEGERGDGEAFKAEGEREDSEPFMPEGVRAYKVPMTRAQERMEIDAMIEHMRAEREYYAPTPAPVVGPPRYPEPMFPIFELISCPDCGNEFEIEMQDTPFMIQCPRCGTSGWMD